MNILIVEDEPQIRSSLETSLRKLGFTDIRKADNAQQALDMLAIRKSDLIVSDIRMPGMSGIELLEEVRKRFGDVLFVVLSGYDLFTYAQKAVKLGAFAYLLKPLKDEDLETVLREALQELTTRRTLFEDELNIKIKLRQGTSELRKQFLTELLNGRIAENQLGRKCETYELDFPYAAFRVWLANIDNPDEFGQTASSRDIELLRYGLENMAGELFKEAGWIAESFHWDEGAGFVLNGDKLGESAEAARLQSISRRIRDAAADMLGLKLTAAIGSGENSLATSAQSLQTALRAYAQSMVQGPGAVYLFEEMPAIAPGLLQFDLKTEQQLFDCFEKGCQADGLRFISERYAAFDRFCSFEVKDVRELNYRLLLLMHNIARQLGLDPEETLGDEYYLYTKVNSFRRITEVSAWFQSLAGNMFALLEERADRSTKKLMEKARDHIAAHFHEDIGLDAVAEHLHISPEYLSREFKKEIGENFIDFLLRVRIQKAKTYIVQGQHKTYEIARLVGYNDEKYFARVFKKVTGFTPREYRFRNS